MSLRRFVLHVAIIVTVALWPLAAGATEVLSDDAARFVKKLGEDAVVVADHANFPNAFAPQV